MIGKENQGRRRNGGCERERERERVFDSSHICEYLYMRVCVCMCVCVYVYVCACILMIHNVVVLIVFIINLMRQGLLIFLIPLPLSLASPHFPFLSSSIICCTIPLPSSPSDPLPLHHTPVSSLAYMHSSSHPSPSMSPPPPPPLSPPSLLPSYHLTSPPSSLPIH